MDTTFYHIESPNSAAPANAGIAVANRVLLVEDNSGDARLLEIFLAESDLQDCEVINKITLTEALTTLESGEEFAAILLDLSLPDSRGFETLERLVARFPNNNIIVLTGLADKSLGVKAVKAGAQDFLIKGAFDSDALAKSLRFSIERSRVLKRLAETQRIANIGSWEYFPGNRFLSVSDEMFRIFGYSLQKTPGQADGLLSEDSAFSVLNQIHEATARDGEYKNDLKIRQLNGMFRYVFVQCRAHQGADGGTFYQGIIQDISERKLTEQEMVKSRERYLEIFTQSKDALFICTFAGRLIDYNSATVDLFGYSKDELESMLDMHTLYYPPERKNEFLLKLKSQRSVKDFDITITRKNNEVRECLITGNIIVTDDLVGYHCILRDVTEQRAAEKLRKARDLARQSTQMKEQFVASISHEMRTPMNAILGMSNLLLQTELNQEQLNLVHSVKQSSEILLGVVNDILEVSSIQNGNVVFENQPFDLYELLSNLVNVMQYKAQEKELFLETILDSEIPRIIRGDKLRLNQVLYNLVGNAIKFTDTGFVKIYVRKLHDIMDSVQLQFMVEDTGIGILESKIEAIFESFTRIRQKDRVYEGTGLGLSICKNLVELQGGKIGASSEPGKGSSFFFDLIFETATELNAIPKPPYHGATDPLDDNASFRLLLVEDHKMNQLVARKTLEKKWKNIQLTIAENGQIAIDLLMKEDFDIILMDIQMPVMDGYEATQIIRRNLPPGKSNMPILAMTAHAHISKDEKFRELGMDDFVLKPFEPDDLFYKIAKYMRR